MAGNIIWENKDFLNGLKRLSTAIGQGITKPVREVAIEILRLSSFEVPHDKGLLQSSGHVEDTPEPTEVIVGYNKVYAARLHEHPEYHFQKGRKGKYLEDPIKNNTPTFIEFIKNGLADILK